MADQLTVLRSPSQRMCKVWLADGTIQQYDLAKWFSVSQHNVTDIHELSALLSRLESDSKACIIRGTPKSEIDLGRSARRIIDNFDDKPLHTVLVEIDNYAPVINDPLLESEDAALEYINECLPAPFQNASFHWQLSNSAGTPGKTHILKAHLWFFLERPYTSAELRAWAVSANLPLDRSVFQSVQIHYTSAPVFETGCSNPVGKRSGLYEGLWDQVPLDIDTSALDLRVQSARKRGERIADVKDPVANWIYKQWDTWGELANGGIVITCPFESQHSQPRRDNDTSTCYFPAGTNSYAEGSFVCLHDHCRDLPKSAFLCEIGYTDSQFAELAAAPSSEEGGVDTDGVPPFSRLKNGTIIANLTNVKMALERADMAGVMIRKDVFKEMIVWSVDAEHPVWVPITDTDLTELRLRLETIGFQTVKKDHMRDMVHHHASKHTMDSAKDWIASLKWDGVPRIDTFWIDHFGVADDARGYARAVGAYAWTALAGRSLCPGIQADMVPILAGRQGLGKSRGLAAMSPDPEFAAYMSFADKDIDKARKMRGRMLVELPELHGLRSREREEIKAWVTRSFEEWTPKWDEMNTVFKRRCVFFGTTNDNDFLDDPTGERRWLPLAVGVQPGFTDVNVQGIQAVCDQLWAEAAVRFAANGVEWSAAHNLSSVEHERYKAEDTWTEAVHTWLDSPTLEGETHRETGMFTTLDVARGALDIPARLAKHTDQRRIGKVLRDAGYVMGVKRVDGKPKRVWYKETPAPTE
jgi:hypothetical protein